MQGPPQELPSDLVGFRWPVGVQREIAVPAADVWAVISRPGNLELIHPFCSRNPVSQWPGERARDEVHYLNGLILERLFSRWIDGRGYDLEIGRAAGGERSFVSWRIGALDAGSCTLRIDVFPHVIQRVPIVIRWLPHLLRVRPMLTSYLSSVIGGVAWFAERREPVSANHWGPHPWFS